MFSEMTKDELARVQSPASCCRLAEFLGIIRTKGIVKLSAGGQMSLCVATDSPAFARKILLLVKRNFGAGVTVAYRRRRNLNKNNTFVLRVDSSAATQKILTVLGIARQDGSLSFGFDSNLVSKNCCCHAYLRGAFLAAGSVSDPERNYHLEIVLSSQQHALELQNLMSSHGFKSRYLNRKNSWIVYLKDSDDIVRFLTMTGAVSAVLHFENIRVYKEMRNAINRLVNCETANVSKAALAAMEQIKAIRIVDKQLGLESLEPELLEVAKLRLAHPYASLRELGQMLTPCVSKSGVNHRIRKLRRLAESLGGVIDDGKMLDIS
jgi:DNA-binding protein WhiA